jgi:predicted dehydrogenase
VVIGTRRTAVFDDTEPYEKVRVHPSSQPGDSLQSLEHRRVREAPELEPLVVEARHFVASILDDRAIPTDAAEGRAVVDTLEGGIRSLRSGRAVALSHAMAVSERAMDSE